MSPPLAELLSKNALIWRSQEGASNAVAKGPFSVGTNARLPHREPHSVQFRCCSRPGTGMSPSGEGLFSDIDAADWSNHRMLRHANAPCHDYRYFLQHAAHKKTIVPAAAGGQMFGAGRHDARIHRASM